MIIGIFRCPGNVIQHEWHYHVMESWLWNIPVWTLGANLEAKLESVGEVTGDIIRPGGGGRFNADMSYKI